jgi:hypothetical protein
MNPLTKPTTTRSQPLVKNTVKPPLNHGRQRMSSGTFAAFPKIDLNTSKSTFMKVVDLVEGHNFNVDWHFKFWVENCEKPLARQIFLFSGTCRHSKLARRSCKIRREKHLMAFFKVVEGS